MQQGKTVKHLFLSYGWWEPGQTSSCFRGWQGTNLQNSEMAINGNRRAAARNKGLKIYTLVAYMLRVTIPGLRTYAMFMDSIVTIDIYSISNVMVAWFIVPIDIYSSISSISLLFPLTYTAAVSYGSHWYKQQY